MANERKIEMLNAFVRENSPQFDTSPTEKNKYNRKLLIANYFLSRLYLEKGHKEPAKTPFREAIYQLILLNDEIGKGTIVGQGDFFCKYLKKISDLEHELM